MREDTNTVLVVDDDPSLRLLCRVNLELEGYAVIEAGTLGEAEAALENGTVDVVLLDMHLGNEQGMALVPAIEERGLGASLALLTGSPGSRLPEGATVIPKPFAIEDYAIKSMCADIDGLIVALGADQAVVIGHDWGAPIA